jgi:two-component system phosphate regulon response regulator PhoB
MKVLIVEDEPSHAVVLEMLLVKWGYEFQSASTAEEASRILQQSEPPRLLILDWMLPRKSGLEFCQEIKKSSDAASVYVLMLTAKAQQRDGRIAMEAGADDYLSKPYMLEELRARIAKGCDVLEKRSVTPAQ